MHPPAGQHPDRFTKCNVEQGAAPREGLRVKRATWQVLRTPLFHLVHTFHCTGAARDFSGLIPGAAHPAHCNTRRIFRLGAQHLGKTVLHILLALSRH